MQTASDVERDRKAAGKFLEGLKDHLSGSISLPDVREWIQKKEDFRPTGKDVQYELLFTDEIVLKAISEYLRKAPGLSANDARVSEAFLAESKHAKKQGWTSGSPSSANKYLFTKVFGANSKSVVTSWWGDSGKGLTAQSCPDWAFRAANHLNNLLWIASLDCFARSLDLNSLDVLGNFSTRSSAQHSVLQRNRILQTTKSSQPEVPTLTSSSPRCGPRSHFGYDVLSSTWQSPVA